MENPIMLGDGLINVLCKDSSGALYHVKCNHIEISHIWGMSFARRSDGEFVKRDSGITLYAPVERVSRIWAE